MTPCAILLLITLGKRCSIYGFKFRSEKFLNIPVMVRPRVEIVKPPVANVSNAPENIYASYAGNLNEEQIHFSPCSRLQLNFTKRILSWFS